MSRSSSDKWWDGRIFLIWIELIIISLHFSRWIGKGEISEMKNIPSRTGFHMCSIWWKGKALSLWSHIQMTFQSKWNSLAILTWWSDVVWSVSANKLGNTDKRRWFMGKQMLGCQCFKSSENNFVDNILSDVLMKKFFFLSWAEHFHDRSMVYYRMRKILFRKDSTRKRKEDRCNHILLLFSRFSLSFIGETMSASNLLYLILSFTLNLNRYSMNSWIH